MVNFLSKSVCSKEGKKNKTKRPTRPRNTKHSNACAVKKASGDASTRHDATRRWCCCACGPCPARGTCARPTWGRASRGACAPDCTATGSARCGGWRCDGDPPAPPRKIWMSNPGRSSTSSPRGVPDNDGRLAPTNKEESQAYSKKDRSDGKRDTWLLDQSINQHTHLMHRRGFQMKIALRNKLMQEANLKKRTIELYQGKKISEEKTWNKKR